MKKFIVTVDVVMSGDVEIEASTKKEAREIAKSRNYSARDLTDFHEIETKIVDVMEDE